MLRLSPMSSQPKHLLRVWSTEDGVVLRRYRRALQVASGPGGDLVRKILFENISRLTAVLQ